MNNTANYFNKFNYFNKTLSALTLATILLVNTPLCFAKDVNANQPVQEHMVNVTEQHIVNLNQSTYEQLITLKGVGHTKAQAIIAYREQFGDFKSIDELTKVSGIGDKIVDMNRERLSL